MGLYDRDYVRTPQPPKWKWPGLRRYGLPVWSFNTWLIVANILVFVLANMVLVGGRFDRPVETGYRAPASGVTAAELDRATLDRSRFVNVYVGPSRVSGYPYVEPRTGRVLGVQLVTTRPALHAWGEFSTAKGFFGLEVWRFVTFQFLHADWMHLLFNLLGLWFVGEIVEQYLGRKRYAAFYLTCGIFGALMYLLLNFLGAVLNPVFSATRPFIIFDNIYTPLVGASAGIFGVLMAAAFVSPRTEVMVLFAIPMRLRSAVYIFTAIAIASLLLGTRNQGGEAAHVGGAIAGFFFIRRMHLLRDFFDVLSDSRAHKSSGRAPPPPPPPPAPPLPRDRAEVDRILAKIAASGVDSLSPAEKQTLKNETEARRRG